MHTDIYPTGVITQGCGSGGVVGPYVISPLDGLRRRAQASGATVSWHNLTASEVAQAAELASAADAVKGALARADGPSLEERLAEPLDSEVRRIFVPGVGITASPPDGEESGEDACEDEAMAALDEVDDDDEEALASAARRLKRSRRGSVRVVS